ncbi:MAG TPA: glycosyltransferase family 39 protein [Ktedonobacterales bacterium]|nr:glycosyltransferase family 39 protein [Ktedonobacterales bacterium]
MATISVSLPAQVRVTTRRTLRARAHHLVANLDWWLTITITLAVSVSITACTIAYINHDTLLYSDAYSHMIIARRVFDNTTPGLAQLGGVWLPLPHMIMLPFVWNITLWSSGIGGAIPSMICYVVSGTYIFLAARRVTRRNTASLLGALVFLLNPNVLYVQSTPLTEPVMIATMTMTSYYFLAWVQDNRQNYLIWAGLCTFFATLARYDGWSLYVAILVLIAIVGWHKRQQVKEIAGNVLLYGILGGFGIALWFLWNLIIFGNPLYFLNGPYSSQVMQMPLIKAGLVLTYHNIGQSIYYYSAISAETLGPVILALAVIAVLVLVVRRVRSPDIWACLAFLVPFVFYIASLYSGQAVEYAPHAVPANVSTMFYNDRYGTQIVAPAAFFIATLLSLFNRWGRTLLFGGIIAQTVLTATGGIITLQDGLYGASCSPWRATTSFLAQHYDNTNILEDTYFQNPQDFAFTVGIDLKNIVYQGSGALWNQSLANPATVHWIYAHPGDLVTRNIDVNSPAFLSQFVPVANDSDGTVLYHLISAPLVQRTASPDMLTLHSACNKQTGDIHAAPNPLLAIRASAGQPIVKEEA